MSARSHRPLEVLIANREAVMALREAARMCMRDRCERHKPYECDCPEQLVTPLEFVAWVENELKILCQEPVRFEPAGRPRRMLTDASVGGLRDSRGVAGS